MRRSQLLVRFPETHIVLHYDGVTSNESEGPMSTEDKSQQRIEKALDTLAELCDAKSAERDNSFTRRTAAEEILRHYREEHLMKNLVVTLNVNGAVPVRPMTRTEMES